jgi:hypothetical protein
MSDDPLEWLQFEKALAASVRIFEARGLTVRTGFQAIPGFPSDGFRADAVVTDGRRLVAVEVEVRQTHPDTNVGKYWLLAKHHSYEHVTLIHVYTPAYNSYPWRMRLGQFYADKMKSELPFEYVLLDRRSATDVPATFLEVKSIVAARISEEFEITWG